MFITRLYIAALLALTACGGASGEPVSAADASDAVAADGDEPGAETTEQAGDAGDPKTDGNGSRARQVDTHAVDAGPSDSAELTDGGADNNEDVDEDGTSHDADTDGDQDGDHEDGDDEDSDGGAILDTAQCGKHVDCAPFFVDKKLPVCHIAGCVDGECTVIKAANGASCSDGNKCTESDTCLSGSCKAGKPVACKDDGNPCTKIACSVDKGCTAWPQPYKVCDDGNVCTLYDKCKGSTCLGGSTVNCQPSSNPCLKTIACHPKKGCYEAANGKVCNDGSACTSGDVCTAGTCSGKAKVCDDNNACTADACNAVTGACLFAKIAGCGIAPKTCAKGKLVCTDGATKVCACVEIDQLLGGISCSDVAIAPHGGVFVGAVGDGFKGTVVRVDSNGKKLWATQGVASVNKIVRAVVPVHDGGVLAIGASNDNAYKSYWGFRTALTKFGKLAKNGFVGPAGWPLSDQSHYDIRAAIPDGKGGAWLGGFYRSYVPEGNTDYKRILYGLAKNGKVGGPPVIKSDWGVVQGLALAATKTVVAVGSDSTGKHGAFVVVAWPGFPAGTKLVGVGAHKMASLKRVTVRGNRYVAIGTRPDKKGDLQSWIHSARLDHKVPASELLAPEAGTRLRDIARGFGQSALAVGVRRKTKLGVDRGWFVSINPHTAQPIAQLSLGAKSGKSASFNAVATDHKGAAWACGSRDGDIWLVRLRPAK